MEKAILIFSLFLTFGTPSYAITMVNKTGLSVDFVVWANVGSDQIQIYDAEDDILNGKSEQQPLLSLPPFQRVKDSLKPVQIIVAAYNDHVQPYFSAYCNAFSFTKDTSSPELQALDNQTITVYLDHCEEAS